jgi:hypothetical protein
MFVVLLVILAGIHLSIPGPQHLISPSVSSMPIPSLDKFLDSEKLRNTSMPTSMVVDAARKKLVTTADSETAAILVLKLSRR